MYIENHLMSLISKTSGLYLCQNRSDKQCHLHLSLGPLHSLQAPLLFIPI